MRVAFYKSTRPGLQGVFNRAVRWWTKGPYSHCELVLSSGMCISSSGMDGGVRSKMIDVYNGNWDVIHAEGSEKDARQWFSLNQGKGYDYLGLAGFVIRPAAGEGEREKYFCSEAVAEMLGFADPWRFDPNTLAAAILRERTLQQLS